MPLIILACLLAVPAHAGAWLRAEGTGFLSTSVLQGEEGQSDGALFFEYGVRPQLTLGLKLDANMIAGRLGGGSGFVFARMPIETGERPFKLAYEIGLGATLDDQTDPLLRTGLSYGRGLKWRDHYGWLAVDFAVEWSLAGETHTGKLDTTMGFSISETTKLMMQVFVSSTETDANVTLAPSIIWQPRPKKPSYQLGLEAEKGELSLRLGLWQEF